MLVDDLYQTSLLRRRSSIQSYRLKIGMTHRELNQTMLTKTTQDTTETAALRLITTAQKEELCLQS